MVAPLIMAAGISAGAGLLGGLMGQKAQEEEARKQRGWELEKTAFEQQMAASRQLSADQQAAFARLIDGYGKALT